MSSNQATNFNRHSHHRKNQPKPTKNTKNLVPIALSIIASSYLCSLNANPQATQNQSTQNQPAQNQAHSAQPEQPAQAQTTQTTATNTQDLPQSQSTQARQEAQASHTEQSGQEMQTHNKTQDTQEPPLESTQEHSQATQNPSLDSTQQPTQQYTDTPHTPPTPAQPKTPKSTQTPYETKELDRVVTTGSALASDIASIPGNTSVINAKAITTQANTKILDIVSKQAGVHIEANASGFNPRPKVKIRGINYGTLVLLDGVILSDLEGEARILSQIFLNEVERVEIARGASSAVYGTGAIGGAINFITAMPKKLEIKAVAGYGSAFIDGEADRNVASAYLSVGNAFFNKRLKLKIHGGFKRSDAYTGNPAYTTANPNGTISGYYQDNKGRYILGTTGERELYIYDAGIKASYELGERDEISATFRVSNHNYDTKNYKTNLRDYSGNPTYTIDGKNYFVGSGNGGLGTYTNILGSIDYLHSFDDSVFRIKASSLNLLSKWQDADNWGSSTSPTYDFKGGDGRGQDIDTSNNYLDFVYENFANESQTFTLGAQARYHKIRQETPKLSNWRDYNSRNGVFNTYGAEVFIASLYASLNSTWVDSDKYGKLGTTLAGRFDNWVDFNNFVRDYENPTDTQTNRDFKTNYLPVFSPNVSLHYTPLDSSSQNLTLKTNLGYGFRMPTMRERFYFGKTRRHSPDLKHEQAISFEVGAEYASKWINTSLYFYNIEMFDMIYLTGSNTESDPSIRKNAGRARINGIEYSLDLPIYDALSFIANYTLTHTQFLNGANKGNYLPAIPLHSANFTLSYAPTKGFYSSLWAHYTSPFFYDDANSRLWGSLGSYDEQFTLNAKAGYAFANGIDISAQFLNMTNNQYWDYYKVAGASFYLQLAYNYKAK